MAQLKSVGAFSVAKLFAIMYAVLGLLIGACFSLIAMVGAAASEDFGPFGALLGVGAIVAFPIIYGIAGAIGGLIMALIYNVCAKIAGGIEVEIA